MLPSCLTACLPGAHSDDYQAFADRPEREARAIVAERRIEELTRELQSTVRLAEEAVLAAQTEAARQIEAVREDAAKRIADVELGAATRIAAAEQRAATRSAPPNAFQVDNILDERKYKGRTEFLLSWVGYDASHNSWEPEAHILDAALIPEFRKIKGAAQATPSAAVASPSASLVEAATAEAMSKLRALADTAVSPKVDGDVFEVTQSCKSAAQKTPSPHVASVAASATPCCSSGSSSASSSAASPSEGFATAPSSPQLTPPPLPADAASPPPASPPRTPPMATASTPLAAASSPAQEAVADAPAPPVECLRQQGCRCPECRVFLPEAAASPQCAPAEEGDPEGDGVAKGVATPFKPRVRLVRTPPRA